MLDEYLTRCVVDPLKKTVYLYSNEGSEKQVSCETVEEFMNVLDFVRAKLDEDTLVYANPLWAKLTFKSILGPKKFPQNFLTRYFFEKYESL